ncbi:MAG: hypothetical protein ACLR3U_08540 [Christensenellaceae bacterium]|nr:MAG: hypothetical protein DBY05_01195 [Clostridiales bacterium]
MKAFPNQGGKRAVNDKRLRTVSKSGRETSGKLQETASGFPIGAGNERQIIRDCGRFSKEQTPRKRETSEENEIAEGK